MSARALAIVTAAALTYFTYRPDNKRQHTRLAGRWLSSEAVVLRLDLEGGGARHYEEREMRRTDLQDNGRAAPVGTAWLSPALVCFLLGLVGALSMVILTPPFQVPDEQEHFHRAYQLSELQLRGVVQDGRAGGMLPSSLIELSEHFLGTRAIHTTEPRRITAQPLRQTWLALDRPLNPDRREFVDFTSTAFYSPMGYLPQAIAIMGGRWAGAAPLTLLYLARLANALVAVAMLTWAVRLMPIGREAVMVAGLLPMAVFEYASAAPDAGVITTAFLFTAVALRMQLRGSGTVVEVALATVSGLIFCSQKPAYAPLLFLGLPSALAGSRIRLTLLAQAVILVVALGGTAFWIRFSLSKDIAPLPGMSVTDQGAYIATHPVAYCKAIVHSLWSYSAFYYKSLIGVLGWLQLTLPNFAYVLPAGALLLSVLAQPRDAPRLPAYAVVWNVFLLTGSILLIMTSVYLIFNQVASRMVENVQGRYFIPLLPLSIATACSIVRLRPSRKGSLVAFLVVTAIIAVQLLTADMAIVRAYQVF
jgi:uncharacterized membrane protein